MKSFAPFALPLALCMFAPATVAPARAADAVEVPDENLREVILEIKKKKQREGDEITQEDLQAIFFLDAHDRGIRDLTGLEHCSNLAEARLAYNHIADAGPLANCKNLQSLQLAHNDLADVGPLGQLVKLQYLDIEHNQIERLDGIETLQALTALYASHNRIAAIDPVAKLEKLWTLHLNHNQIKDIGPIAGLKRLDNLGLAHNEIEDVSPVPPGNSSYATYLQKNRISDIGPLVELARKDAEGEKRFVTFWKLYLAGNPLSEESASQHLAELQELGVRVNMEYER